MDKIRNTGLNQIIKALPKMREEQFIFGEPHHPKRLEKTYEAPDYVRQYGPRSPMVKMHYCLEGSCVITINGVSFLLDPGDLCIINRNAVTFESHVTPGEPYVLYHFIVREWLTLGMHTSVFNKSGGLVIKDHQNIKITDEILKAIDQTALSGPEEIQEAFDTLKDRLQKIFVTFSKQKVIAKPGRANKWHTKLLTDIRNYIQKDYHKDMTVPEIARRYSYNPAYLDTLFKQQHGVGLKQFIIICRMGRAAMMLEKSPLNITEVALKCGYENNHYFSRLFKKVYGIPPKQYRDSFA